MRQLRVVGVIGAAVFGIAAALGGASLGQAQDFERAGFYVGGGWLQTVQDFDDELESALVDELGFNPGLNVDVDDTHALNLVVGLRAGSRVALEFVGEQYSSLDFDLNLPGGSVSGDIDLRTGLLMTKLYILTGRVQPYVTLGAGYFGGTIKSAGAKERFHSGMARAGIGAEIYLTPHWSVNLQGAYSRELVSDLDEDLAFYTFGGSVIFRF